MSSQRKEVLYSIGLGILLMIGAISIQSVLQSIPAIYLIVKYGLKELPAKIVALEVKYPLIYAIYIGTIAGVMQELFKYLAVELKPKVFAFWIGIGFSVVDISVLSIDVAIIKVFTVFVLLNVIVSLSFHPGTAMMLKYGRLANSKYLFLSITIILHSFIDGGLAFLDILSILVKPAEINYYINIYWSIVMLISVSVLILGWIFINRVQDKPNIYGQTAQF